MVTLVVGNSVDVVVSRSEKGTNQTVSYVGDHTVRLEVVDGNFIIAKRGGIVLKVRV